MGSKLHFRENRTQMIVSIICPCPTRSAISIASLVLSDSKKRHEFDLEIFIADGESTDGTADVLGTWLAREPRLKIIRNPGRIVSTGLNAALRVARGDVVVRMDVHTAYSEDYVAQCVNTLEHTGATCVGGPWLAKGSSLRQERDCGGVRFAIRLGWRKIAESRLHWTREHRLSGRLVARRSHRIWRV